MELDLIHEWITRGITLDLISSPADIIHDNTRTVDQYRDEVRTRLQEYIEFQAVVELPNEHHCEFGVQPLHAIIKSGKKPRLVIDLSRNLNDHLAYKYFSYSTVREAVELSTPDCWYGKLDLSNCFLSFPLHPSAWPHFIFCFEDKLYQFRRMPFGLSSAPRICTLLLSVVAFYLKHNLAVPIDLIRYLDDFLFITRSKAAMQHTLSAAQQAISAFGLVVNQDKTAGPAQQLEFLGIQLDSVAQTLSLTPARIQELLTLLAAAPSAGKVKPSFVESLIGKLQFAATVLPGARPFVRRMLDFQQALRRKKEAVDEKQSSPALQTEAEARQLYFQQKHTPVKPSKGFHQDVRFWQAHLLHWNGRARWRSAQSAPFCFASDASLAGFGFYLESTPAHIDTSAWSAHLRVGAGFSGVYSPAHWRLHRDTGQMTWCEMFAVYAALHTYRSILRDSCVLFFVDNETDVFILNRQATGSRQLAGLLREIYTIALHYNISIYAKHRSGVDNILADFLSRPALHGGVDILDTWRDTHPSLSYMLSCVSVVHSAEFVRKRVLPQSNPSSSVRSGTAPSAHTPLSSKPSPSSASRLASTQAHRSQRTVSAG